MTDFVLLVTGDVSQQKCCFTNVTSYDDLVDKLQQQLHVDVASVYVFDESDFNDWVLLRDLRDLPSKARIRVNKKTYHMNTINLPTPEYGDIRDMVEKYIAGIPSKVFVTQIDKVHNEALNNTFNLCCSTLHEPHNKQLAVIPVHSSDLENVLVNGLRVATKGGRTGGITFASDWRGCPAQLEVGMAKLLICEVAIGNTLVAPIEPMGVTQELLSQRGYDSTATAVLKNSTGVETKLQTVYNAAQVTPRYVATLVVDPADPLSSCQVHPNEPLKFFCKADKRLVCSLCTVSEGYQASECAPISEIAAEERSNASDTRQLLLGHLDKHKRVDLELTNLERNVRDCCTQAQKEICSQLDEIMAVLQERKRCLTAKVMQYENTVCNAIEVQRANNTKASSNLQVALDNLKDSLCRSSDLQFLHDIDDSIQYLHDLPQYSPDFTNIGSLLFSVDFKHHCHSINQTDIQVQVVDNSRTLLTAVMQELAQASSHKYMVPSSSDKDHRLASPPQNRNPTSPTGAMTRTPTTPERGQRRLSSSTTSSSRRSSLSSTTSPRPKSGSRTSATEGRKNVTISAAPPASSLYHPTSPTNTSLDMSLSPPHSHNHSLPWRPAWSPTGYLHSKSGGYTGSSAKTATNQTTSPMSALSLSPLRTGSGNEGPIHEMQLVRRGSPTSSTASSTTGMSPREAAAYYRHIRAQSMPAIQKAADRASSVRAPSLGARQPPPRARKMNTGGEQATSSPSKQSTSNGEEGEGVQRCAQCNKVYNPKSNQTSSCRYHPQPWKASYGVDGVVQYWQCCYNTLRAAPGCASGSHVPHRGVEATSPPSTPTVQSDTQATAV
eukprot:TRINITY_DN112823_c0_g1_i1.p1 TRINITY_DN112823_c0_g1~~TRINITY_DN112823_c0_g1_i1.p1  ORF type:complete len:835 (+),score=68.39 TRINITY_DN112823_c0_g1_i1:95-2599(+)